MPFLDRAIPVAVAEALAVPMADVMAHDERRTSGLGRLFASLARAAAAPDTAFGSAPTAARASLGDHPEQAFRDQTERVIHQVAETDGWGHPGPGRGHRAARPAVGAARAVGRAERSTHPACGRPRRRRRGAGAQAARGDGPCPRGVREALLPVRRPRRSSHYHLVLDSTALEFDDCVELIVAAAKARNLTPS